MDVIRCDDNESLIVKWSSDKGEENDIIIGSSLRVKEGQVALFLYKQDKETFEEYIEGPFDKILVTKNLPILSKLLGVAYHGKSPFQAEIYFINLISIHTLFGIPFFNVFDYKYEDFSVPICVRGSMEFKIKDYRKVISEFGLRGFTKDDFYKRIIDKIMKYIKSTVLMIPQQAQLSCLKLESQMMYINQIVEGVLKDRLDLLYGIELRSLDISSLEVDKESKDYQDLMKVSKKISIRDIVHKARISRIKDDVEVAKDIKDIVVDIIDKIKPV